MASLFLDAIHDPAAQPFLPLLYAAWDDGQLTGDELAGLRELLCSGGSVRQSLLVWLDPQLPPNADDLAHLARHVQGLFEDATGTPVDLGTTLSAGAAELLSQADDLAGPFGPPAGLRRSRPSITLAALPDPGEAQFDVAELSRLIDGPHVATKLRLRRILSRPEFRYQYGLSSIAYREQVLAWTRILAAEGVGKLGLPRLADGDDDQGAFIAAFQTIAHHDLSLLTKFGVQFGLHAGAIQRLGTDRHHRAYLADAGSLAVAGCFAMTETGHGSNVAGLETTATFDAATDELIVNTPNELARKDYIGNAAAHGQVAVVFARLLVDDLDFGVHAVVVPIRTSDGEPQPRVRIEDAGHKAGLNGVDNGRIWFDQVRIPRDNLLDRFAQLDADGTYTSEIASPTKRFFTTLGTLVGGRVSVGTASISAAETALTIAIRYGTRRRQFGGPGGEITLLDYPSHQRRLLPRLATTYAYHFAFAELAADYVASLDRSSVDSRELEGRAAGLKAFGTWHAMDTIQAAREACGGQGYLAENRFGDLRSDVDVFTTYEGDNTVLAQLLTKSLLTGYRSSFEDMSPIRMVRYLTQRVSDVIAETVPRLGAVTDPTDPASQLELLSRRESHSVETLALRIKKRIDDGTDPAAAFVAVQAHALHAARAHIERVAFEAFNRVIGQTADGDVATLLDDVRSLYALSAIEQDLGWFIAHGTLTSDSTKRITSSVTRLSATLRPNARHLVDAFGIPDEILAAPIAL